MGAAQEANVVNLSRYRVKEKQVNRFEHDNTVWSVSIEPTVPFEEILKPEYWGNVARPKNMKIGDELKVTPHDNSWRATLLVRDVGNVWAKVALLHKDDFDKQDQASYQGVAGFHVEWRGLADKHVVVREKDNAVIVRGIKSKTDAQIAMLEHVKSVGS